MKFVKKFALFYTKKETDEDKINNVLSFSVMKGQ